MTHNMLKCSALGKKLTKYFFHKPGNFLTSWTAITLKNIRRSEGLFIQRMQSYMFELRCANTNQNSLIL